MSPLFKHYAFGWSGLSPMTTFKLPWDPEPEEPKKLETDTADFPMIAYRRWSVLHPGYLCDTNHFSIWEPRRKVEAACRSMKKHRAPQVDCGCGVYALKTKDQAVSQYAPREYAEAYGEVWIWGTVIECENGYRAEYAYPKSITIRYGNCYWSEPLQAYDGWLSRLCDTLRRNYGVPVTVEKQKPKDPEKEISFNGLLSHSVPWSNIGQPIYWFGNQPSVMPNPPLVPPEDLSLVKEPTEEQAIKYGGKSLTGIRDDLMKEAYDDIVEMGGFFDVFKFKKI